MATKAGVWIDHKQAIVVLLTGAGQQVKKFTTTPEKAVLPVGSPRPKPRHTPNDFIAEDRRERKLVSDRKQVFADVLACLRGAEALFIVGPGEAKGEFSKYIAAKKVRGLTVTVETADKLSERQLVAKVNGHFAKPAARKTAPAKKRARSEAEIAKAKKRNKKVEMSRE